MSEQARCVWVLTLGALLTIAAVPVGGLVRDLIPPMAAGLLTAGMMIGGLVVFLIGMWLRREHHER